MSPEFYSRFHPVFSTISASYVVVDIMKCQHLLCCGVNQSLFARNHYRNLIRERLLSCLLLAAGVTAMAGTAVAQQEAPSSQIASVQAARTVDFVLEQSYRAMYNLDFDAALRKTQEAKALDSTDPTPWMAQACAVLFREFNRLHVLRSEMFASDAQFDARPAQTWNPLARKQFDDALAGAERVANARLDGDKYDAKALFALTLVNGLRADDSALISKKNLTALSYTKTADAFAERLLARYPDYYDARIATGMGKYIIGGKAAPVRWMLRLGGLKGDQAEGVRELNLVADRGHYLAPFAQILLSFDDLRHKNKESARKRLESLHERFPGNTLFIEEIAKLDQPTGVAGH